MTVFKLNGKTIVLPRGLNLTEEKLALIESGPDILADGPSPIELYKYILGDRKSIGNMARLELNMVKMIVHNARHGLVSVVTAPVVFEGIPTRPVDGDGEADPILCFESVRDSIYRLAKLGFLKRIEGFTYHGKYIYLTADELPEEANSLLEARIVVAPEAPKAVVAPVAVAKDDTLVSVMLDDASLTLMKLAAMYRNIEAGTIDENWAGILIRDSEKGLWTVITKLNALIQKYHVE